MINIQNNYVVEIPSTIGADNVMLRLNSRCRKGNVHIVAYTNVDNTKKARNENMHIVKITDTNCILGHPKSNSTNEGHFTRLDNILVQYSNGDKAISTQINKHFKTKTYYFDKNTGKIYDKHYLMDNGYIYKKKDRERVEGEPMWVSFKLDNIIYIK